MDARTLTIKEVFAKDIRYVIPMFQRPYVWNLQIHWEPLWDDVRTTAERYIRNLSLPDVDSVQAEQATAPHFLGAVVVDQLAFGTGDVEARHVIDGQQRLTTLQLLLDAVQETIHEVAPGREATLLRKLVLNDPDVAVNPDHCFKVWPTNVDRPAFRTTMDDSKHPSVHAGTPIADAHTFFKRESKEWLLEVEGEERSNRVAALNVVLHTRLQLVVIDLEPQDNAQVIFETLNARGTPLAASDLVKNHLLQTAEARGLDVEALYEDRWKRFDEPHWRKEQKQGRIKRPRIDAFLDYWLELRTLTEVAPHDVFPSFRSLLNARTTQLEETAIDLCELSAIYDSLSEATYPSFETFLKRWLVMEVQTATPLLLWLFSKADEVGEEQLRLATCCLESYLVRRMVLRLTTKNYNQLFLEALQDLGEAGPEQAGRRFQDFLARQTSDARYWPSDSEFARGVVKNPLYRWLSRSRLRMILEALENELRTDHSEEKFRPSSKVTIEHLIPQSWTPLAWPLDDPDDAKIVARREGVLHSIGNLTLVNDKLNPTLSNGAWKKKRAALDEHSVLRLNREVLAVDAPWSDERAVSRGRTLATRLVKIWPGAKREEIDYDQLTDEDWKAEATSPRPDISSSRATVLSLLESGLVEADELLIWRRPEIGEVFEARILASGQIQVNGEVFESPSGAARAMVGRAANGWKAWRIPRLDDIPIGELRDELDLETDAD